MGNPRGFLNVPRETPKRRPVDVRILDWKEVYEPQSIDHLRGQASRCMDCGIPFCHQGCPLGNLIPEWNDLMYRGDYDSAIDRLHATNNFPEFTGRLCPAPCETACVVAINQDAVTIKQIELRTVEEAFGNDSIKPLIPSRLSGKTVAVIGSGPAGLAAAQQLNRAGHSVTVFERDAKIGGLLRYGIPDFKLEKKIIDRRVSILEAEGIIFKTGIEIGKDIPAATLENDFDAIVLCTGATVKRNLPIPGSDAEGVVQAMDFLPHNNKVVDGLTKEENALHAKGKHVIVIGGGDTGSDCIGTSNRHGAKSVTNFEIMPKPQEGRSEEHPWPYWPFRLKTSSSHEEGVHREWSILTKEFVKDAKGHVKGLKTVDVRWKKIPGARPQMEERPGSEKEWPCDLALLALGFTGPEQSLPAQFGLSFTDRGNLATQKSYQTNKPHIFSAGDARRGQSLIVWAISEGREAAHQIDTFLMGQSKLPQKNSKGDLVSA